MTARTRIKTLIRIRTKIASRFTVQAERDAEVDMALAGEMMRCLYR